MCIHHHSRVPSSGLGSPVLLGVVEELPAAGFAATPATATVSASRAISWMASGAFFALCSFHTVRNSTTSACFMLCANRVADKPICKNTREAKPMHQQSMTAYKPAVTCVPSLTESLASKSAPCCSSQWHTRLWPPSAAWWRAVMACCTCWSVEVREEEALCSQCSAPYLINGTHTATATLH